MYDARMYHRGLGVQPDRAKAASWMEIAGQQRLAACAAAASLWRLGQPTFPFAGALSQVG